VKCQNLKTQEVVAVKVVKNKTAYFNQSMMEVSVLDLVCLSFFSAILLWLTVYSSIRSMTRTTTTISFDLKILSYIDNIYV
jgi:hypothetical protein